MAREVGSATDKTGMGLGLRSYKAVPMGSWRLQTKSRRRTGDLGLSASTVGRDSGVGIPHTESGAAMTIFVRIGPRGFGVISERHPFEVDEVYLTALQQYEAAFERYATLACGNSIYGSLALLGARNDKTESENLGTGKQV
jgi:hypothetical protein